MSSNARQRDRDPSIGFLVPPDSSEAVQKLYDEDVEGLGYVMNSSRLWAHSPRAMDLLSGLMAEAEQVGGLSFRQRGILITALASTLGDSYCSLAWGEKLATKAGADLAAGVLQGDDDLLDASERALAAWARRVVRDPNAITADDVQELRAAGFGETQIFGITLFVAVRLAFSTVNDALGARPDSEIAAAAPDAVRRAVTFGRLADS